MKVSFGGMLSGLCKVCVMRKSKWSDERSCSALHVSQRTKSEETKEISGEIWLLFMLYGMSVLLSMLIVESVIYDITTAVGSPRGEPCGIVSFEVYVVE